MAIGHHARSTHNPRQCGHIHGLFQHFDVHVLHQTAGAINEDGHAHAGLHRHLPSMQTHGFQVGQVHGSNIHDRLGQPATIDLHHAQGGEGRAFDFHSRLMALH